MERPGRRDMGLARDVNPAVVDFDGSLFELYSVMRQHFERFILPL